MTANTMTAAKPTVDFIALGRLRFGHEAPEGSINSRATERGAGMAELKASIQHEGVLQSVLACDMDGDGELLYLAIGNRRLLALHSLRKDGAIDDSYPVPAIIRSGITPAQARSASLAENIIRAPLHPVDRFEAFAQHVTDGMEAAEIAARYTITKRVVQQSLALGQLSPKVREAWRAGKVSAEAAQSFTLAKTHEAQDAALSALGKSPQAYQVRHHVVGSQHDAEGLLKFVGRKNYEAAGGHIIEDLFEKRKYVSDVALLAKLVGEALLVECGRLVDIDGWAWASTEDGVGNARYSWKRAHAEPNLTAEQAAQIEGYKKEIEVKEAEGDYDALDVIEGQIEEIMEAAGTAAYSAAQKAKSGCVVSVDHNGTVRTEAGYVKPTDNGKLDAADVSTKDKERAEKKKESGGLSEALANRLTEQLTLAAGHALDHDTHVALCALLAGLVTSHGSPVRVSTDGMEHDLGKMEKFETVFARVLGMDDKARKALLTRTVAGALDLRLFTRQRQGIQPKSTAALVDALPAQAMNKELRRLFDAKDYFEGASKTLGLKAIEEAVNKDEARKLANKPKGEVVKFALANVPKTGWLPEPLRTAHYDGPGAKAKAGTKSAKPKKAKR